MPRESTPVLDRIMARVVKNDDGCWLWTGATSNGYGIVQLGRGIGTARVHRVVYEAMVGPLRKGLTIDHLCFVSVCCNPAHLEQVTRAENTRRQWVADHADPQRARREQTHCKRGHPLSGDNLRVTRQGTRVCRTCRREHRKRSTT